MKASLSKIILASMFITSHAFAQGGSSGASGGSGAITLADGSTLLADPWVVKQTYPDEKILGRRVYLEKDFSAEFVVQLKKAIKIMDVYAHLEPTGKHEKSVFYDKVFGSNADYRLVDEIPSFCTSDRPIVENLPADALKVDTWACNYGNYVFIVAKKLASAKDYNEVVRLIIHERLHDMETYRNSPIADSLIPDLTNGIQVALQVKNQQEQGLRPRLNEEERAKLLTMIRALREYGAMGRNFHPENEIDIAENGGGIILGKKSDLNHAYIGINSVARNVTAPESVEMIDSVVMHSNLGYSTRVNASQLNSVTTENQVHIDSSEMRDVQVGERSRFQNSDISGSVRLGKQTIANYLHLDCNQGSQCSVGDGGQFERISLYGSITIGREPVMKEFYVNKLRSLAAGDRVEISNLNLEVSSPEAVEATGYVDLVFGNDTRIKGLGDTRFRMRTIERNQNVIGAIAIASLGTGIGVGVETGSALIAAAGVIGAPAMVIPTRKLAGATHTLIFKDIQIDRSGMPAICKSGKNDFYDEFGLTAVINHDAELKRRCLGKRRSQRINW